MLGKNLALLTMNRMGIGNEGTGTVTRGGDVQQNQPVIV
jgi:hypothetical protein